MPGIGMLAANRETANKAKTKRILFLNCLSLSINNNF